MKFLFLFAFAYLIGSVNTSIILFKIAKKPDPRNSFSKNPGATNVYRQEGFLFALFVLLIDILKAYLIGFLGQKYFEFAYLSWISFGLILGNTYPCFHNFKGGKGVAHYLGFVLSITPIGALVSILAYGITYFFMKIPFVSSFIMVFFLGLTSLISCEASFSESIGMLATMGFIYFNHRKNISEFFKLS